ncbi:leucine-rich repeat-containing protein 63 isoform X2 [Antechinus flavipes]|uniref:leucine-rich repeat-containing protein 63 isoform X2 n=1 Tax=Antechinus flavipes TaxID=38775 RepID=UPI002236A70B|nr:leucine-rich repeat-containing protein 63 isoform X2 [Antechinus flavipes]
MLTLPKLLRKPLPPKSQLKPLQLKKGKKQTAFTKQVSKQKDLLQPCPSKIIPTEIEKNGFFGRFPKRRKQSRIHIKTLLLKWPAKGPMDPASRLFLKKYPRFYMLFSNIKDTGSLYLPSDDLIKYGSLEKECVRRKMRHFLMDSTVSSEISTSTSSQLVPSQVEHSSSFIKPDFDHLTTPDSISSSRSVDKPETESKKEKVKWYEKLKEPHDTMNNQIFSFDELPATLERKPVTHYLLDVHHKEEETKEPIPIEHRAHFPDSTEVAESEKDLVVYGEGYNKESVHLLEDSKINLAKIAVLKCQEFGRNALSLKGFFIDKCPDLSILADQLVYLNLSYNNLAIFPPEVIVLINLQVLIMKNNPIKEIPSTIEELKHLTIFVISFNLLTSLPKGLFTLSELEFLDVSYNEILVIPKEIQYLRSLNYLKLDGNELTTFPPEILKLSLDKFSLENNFTHPLLWKENSKNDAQTLKDLTLLFLSQNELWKVYKDHFSPEIKQQLNTVIKVQFQNKSQDD